MSETPATYGADLPQAGRGVPAAPPRATIPLVSTIHWTRVADGLPPYGVTVAVWSQSLNVVVRAYFAAGGEWNGNAIYKWRLAGDGGPELHPRMVTAWADLPNGVLPPPDGGAAAGGEGSRRGAGAERQTLNAQRSTHNDPAHRTPGAETTKEV